MKINFLALATYLPMICLWGLGTSDFSALGASPPMVTGQPESQAILLSDTATFAVTAVGTQPLCPQWRFNGTEIPDATNLTLRLSDVQWAYGGTYDCVITNAYGRATSQSAQLMVSQLTPAGQWSGFSRGLAMGVAISGGVAYVAAGSAGLQILDVRHPDRPIRLGGCTTSGNAYAVAVSGPLAFVADWQSGLHIIDVSHPDDPVRLGGYDTSGLAHGVAVSGSTVYVVDYDGGLHIIDVSNPTSPVRLGGCDTAGYARGVAVSGATAYVADGEAGLQIIDVTDPASPVRLGGYHTGGDACSVAVSGSIAYVANSGGGLLMIDVRHPASPVPLGTYDTVGNALGVAVSGAVAYVADSYAGLHIIDVSNPTSPVRLGGYDTRGSACGVAVSGNIAYVADWNAGLQIVDVSFSAGPVRLGDYDTSGDARGIAMSDSLAYVADGYAGLHIIDVSSPARPVRVGSYAGSKDAYGIVVSGSLAYVADGSAGLLIIDMSNPASPVPRGSYGTSGNAQGVAVSGSLAYVADGYAGLHVIDVSNPTSPVWLGSYDTSGNAQGVAVSGNLAYVADFDVGLQIIDVSNPARPVRLGSYNTSGQAYGVAISGTLAYVADGSAGLQVIEVNDPARPVRVGGYDTGGAALGVVVSGTLAYVADGLTGLQIIGVKNPTRPVRLGGCDTRGQARGVAVSGRTVCVADGGWGLAVLELSPIVFSQQPQSQTVVKGATVDLSVMAHGTEPLHYQWCRDGHPLMDGGNRSGATTPRLILTDAQPTDANDYTVVVTNAFGSVTSAVGTVTVVLFEPPVVLVDGVVYTNNTLTVNHPVTIECRTTLTDGFLFYSLDGSEPDFGRLYLAPFPVSESVVVRALVYSFDFAQWAEARPFFLSLGEGPAITQQPTGQTVAEGATVAFNVGATGNPPPRFQWYKDGVPLPGQTRSSLSFSSAQLADTGAYWVVAFNTAGATTSTVASLTVLTPPGFTFQPVSMTAVTNREVILAAVASGSGPYIYQWRINGVNIPDATNADLILPSLQVSEGGSYSVLVSSPVGVALSESVALWVQVGSMAAPEDNFIDRALLSGLSGTATGTVVNATRETSEEPFHAGKYGTNSIWYRWIAPTNGIARFETAGSTFDTLLGIYQGSSLAGLTNVARDEDQGGALTSQLQFNAQQDVEYQIAIDGFAGTQGDFVLKWDLEPREDSLPVITEQPASQTVGPGESVVLTVVATNGPLTYQWHLNGAEVLNATNATLTLSNVQPADVGTYVIGVTNAIGLGVPSEAAVIEIGSSREARSQNKVEDIFFADLVGSAPSLRSGRALLLAAPPVGGGFTPVTVGTSGYQVMNNTSDNTQNGEPPPCGVIGGRSRWFGLRATAPALMSLDTIGSAYDTVLAVYTGTNSVRTLETVACDNNGAPDRVRSRVVFMATQGTEYSVAVDGVGGAPGETHLNWRLGWPATVQVTGATQHALKRGGRLLLGVQVIGANPSAVCQWYRDGELLASATNTSLLVTNMQPAQQGTYWVAVSNLMEVVTQTVARVTVEVSEASVAASTFDEGLEGWNVTDDLAVTNGGGFLSAAQPARVNPWYWVAAGQMLGDQSAVYGGWLQFEVRRSAGGGPVLQQPVVLLEGGELQLKYNWNIQPGTAWAVYRLPLQEQGWKTGANAPAGRAEMLRVLGGLTGVQIRGAHSSGAERVELDNVMFVLPCTDTNSYLKMSLVGSGTAELSWPVNAGKFEVQSSGQVAGGTWSLVVCERTVVGCRNRVIFDTGPGQRFYRLR